MNPAEKIVEKFGGQLPLARLLNKRQGTVWHWTKSGVIPSKWHDQILRVAGENNILVLPSDLIPPPPAPKPPRKVGLPKAAFMGVLTLDGAELTCFVLNDGRRVISRSAIARGLDEKSKDFERIRQGPVEKFLPPDLDDQMVEFEIKGVTHTAKGLTADAFLDICAGLVRAMNSDAQLTERQRSMAVRASALLAACAKIGLIALIDEVTGNQYDRPADELQMKLKAYLADEMRKWERTFPDQLWLEFGRLTNWKGTASQRPKYWGKLVMELVYDYLDKDVADWLRQNAPSPRKGQNYHQWLTGQFGLKKLTEHVWMLIGMASTCHSMRELKTKMAERFGRIPVQFTLFVNPPVAPSFTPLPQNIVASDLEL